MLKCFHGGKHHIRTCKFWIQFVLKSVAKYIYCFKGNLTLQHNKPPL